MDFNTIKNVLQPYKGDLLEVFFDEMNNDSWLALIDWLRTRETTPVITCYTPDRDELDHLPDNVKGYLDADNFCFSATIDISGIVMIIGFYDEAQIECSIDPEEIHNEQQFADLLNTLNEIRMVCQVAKYIICPEFHREKTFIINGELTNSPEEPAP